MTTPAERVRRRPFLCRFNLWHRWEWRPVRLMHSGAVARLQVCHRCRTAKWPR